MIAVTTGCFDILHKGHTHLIKTMCEASYDSFYYNSVIILNDDNYIRNNKGREPINDWDTRKSILQSYTYCDVLIARSEDDIIQILKDLKKRDNVILFKGEEYANKNITGEDIVDSVVLVRRKYDVSTTQIIAQLKSKANV